MRERVKGKEVRLALAFISVATMVVAAWYLSHVILLAFAALIVAAIVHGTKDVVKRFTPLGSKQAMPVAVAVLFLSMTGFLFFLGHHIYAQLGDLFNAMPELIQGAVDALGIDDFSGALESLAESIDPGAFAGGLSAGILGVFGAAAALIVMIMGGVYFAAEPNLYRNGLIALFPRNLQERIGQALDTSAGALKRWLAGQLIAMVVIGAATTLTLLLLGLPSALAIGFIAGVFEFVPFIGPILAAIPALLVAFAEGEEMFFQVAVLYVLIQQIEGNVLVPLIQRRTVRLPPAVGLFAILAFGIAFGPWGLVLATPMTVVLMVLVQKLYIQPKSE